MSEKFIDQDLLDRLDEINEDLGEVYEYLLRQYPANPLQPARVGVLAARGRVMEVKLFLEEKDNANR